MCKIQHQNKSIPQRIDGKINAWPFELSSSVGLGCNEATVFLKVSIVKSDVKAELIEG